jgi:hypothetical protein
MRDFDSVHTYWMCWMTLDDRYRLHVFCAELSGTYTKGDRVAHVLRGQDNPTYDVLDVVNDPNILRAVWGGSGAMRREFEAVTDVARMHNQILDRINYEPEDTSTTDGLGLVP